MSEPLYKSSRHDRPHARLYDHHMRHPSWLELSGNAAKLFATLLAAYRPDRPNCFPVGDKRAGELIGVSPSTGKRAVNELVKAGYLRQERKGRNTGKARSRERIVSLTRFDTETSRGDPDYPNKVWKAKAKPSRQNCALNPSNLTG